MALRPIIETCTPRSDVLEGGLTDAHFAAQLDQVVSAPEKYAVYGDPTEFFAVTFPTKGLKELLTSTFARLSGKGGKASGAEHGVVRFQTSFGGGKTHGLIAAYHLAKGARPLGVETFVDPKLLPDECAVAAAVGDTIDAESGSSVVGQRIQTMWGSIAAQLGVWDQFSVHDENRTAPGKDMWTGVFEAAPTLVIIDEVAAHIRNLGSSGNPDLRRQAAAVTSFLFNLFAAAAEVPTARVVITLATDSDAFANETAAVEEVLNPGREANKEAESVISRYREVLVPAQDDEIAGILRRRLFADIDAKAATDAGKAFAKTYADLEKRDVRLNFSGNVAEAVANAYPFHPELVKVLDSRVGTVPEFQRTRGALRLLAETVSALWERKSGAVVINVADLPLDATPVANAITRAIGKEAFAPVIGADVAGAGSHAVVIDETRFAGSNPYTTRAATTVLLHSLQLVAGVGATLVDVWRGSLAPADDPDLVEEALRQLDQSAWHLDYDGSRYRFQTEPNPRKIVEDEKSGVQPSMVREELERRIGLIFANAGPIKTRTFPASPADLDDKPELRLAIMHWDDHQVTAKTASPPSSSRWDMLDTFGVARANRTNRNGLVFLVADTDHIDGMREAIRYDLAAQRIVNDAERLRSYAEDTQKKLKGIADKAKLDARVAITRCYRHLYYPKRDKPNHHLRHHELPAQAQGEQEKNQTPVIQQALEGLGKIRTKAIAADFLASVAGFPKNDPVSTKDTLDSFWRNHDADLVLNPILITDAITAGVRNGAWVYYDADTEKAYTDESPPPAARVASTTWLYSRKRAEEEDLLRRDPTLDDVSHALDRAGGELSGTELRSKVEAALKSEPTKASLTGILARATQQATPPIVVVEGDPSAESKLLSPSAIERLPLDRMTVLAAARAEQLGISVGETKTKGFTFEEMGAPGQVFGTLGDKVADLGPERKINHLEIRVSVVGGDTAPVRTLLASPPMMAKLQFSTSITGSATYDGISGDVSASNLSGPEKDLRKLVKELFDVWDGAIDLTIDAAITHAPAEPFGIESETWITIASTLTDLKPGHISVILRGS
ncbi:MAG: DUF499 domain-containing protein [Acidobacteria bacterium]|nr:DUF499 domain-containing protein [Acidobacteriota bacterium]